MTGPKAQLAGGRAGLLPGTSQLPAATSPLGPCSLPPTGFIRLQQNQRIVTHGSAVNTMLPVNGQKQVHGAQIYRIMPGTAL